MSEHRLDPLLKPESIALVGASDRANTPGNVLADMVINSSFGGEVFPVNPRADSIGGLKCYPTIESLPKAVDHVVLALANQHLESALRAVIEHGAKAVTIYSSGILEENEGEQKPLLMRLREMAKSAGLVICGCNGMGFYSVNQQLFAGIFPKSADIQKGGISYIAQSGSAFTSLSHNGFRLGFNLCVSSGNEMVTTVADYMDWSLEQPDTRVIGLFLEAVRDPQAFVAALEKAVKKNIPVVILKIGKSPLSARMALTHTGAIAGDQAAFEALFRRFGVIQVDDFDEMAATLMLLQNSPKAFPGSLATIQESGGFRELVTDIAHELDVEFAEIKEETKTQIQAYLSPGLKAENPLDAWDSHDDFENRFLACMTLLMQDPNVAGGVFFSNFRDGYYLSEAILTVMSEVAKKTDKPIAMGNCYSDLLHTDICRRAHQMKIPVIDGTRETLLAFKHIFSYQQFKAGKWSMLKDITPDLDRNKVSHWREKLQQNPAKTLTEVEAMQWLAAFYIPVVQQRIVDDESGLLAAARSIGYPLVLKTAEAGIHHKSDVGGVIVNIQTEDELIERYQDLCQRLGPSVLLSQMVNKGVEVGLGVVNDDQFGPFLMVAAGGVLIELLAERTVALCPLNHEQANDLLAPLKISSLLDGLRGNPELKKEALIDCMVRLSCLAYEFRDVISEIDINPVIVNQEVAIAVDALIVVR